MDRVAEIGEVIYGHYKDPSHPIDIIGGLPFERYDDMVKKKSKSTLLAHIYQGLEAQALNILVKYAGENLILQLHDGILTSEQLHQQHIEQETADADNYIIRLGDMDYITYDKTTYEGQLIAELNPSKPSIELDRRLASTTNR